MAVWRCAGKPDGSRVEVRDTTPLTTNLGEQVNGTLGNDTVHAVLSSTATQSTLNVGDLIDGKGGNDTLKLIVDTAGVAPSLPAGLQVSNVENIEITNGGSLAAAVDASAFVGATTIKQIASAVAVQKLAATTTAAFASIETAGLTVTADAAAASANVALDKVKTSVATGNVVNLNVAADAANTTLAAVNVAGNIVQKDTTPASPATAAIAEKQTIDFSATTAVTTNGNITVGGFTVALTTAATTPALVAGQVAAAINNQTVNGALVTAVAAGNTVVITYPAAAGNVATNAVVATPGGSLVVVTGALPAAATETTAGVLANAGTAAPAASLALNVALGKDVQAATVNTAVKTTLTIENAAGSTKNMTSVDASASTGGITYQGADAQVATIKTGAGDDTVDIRTATSATVAALVETGAGKDTINVLTTGTGKVTVNAGAGDDTIAIGAGGTGSLTTAFAIDGGEGVDTLKLAGKTLIAEDIALFNAVVKNVEGVEFTGGTAAVVDASKLAFTAYTFAGNAGDKVTEASAPTLTTKADLTAVSTGYKIDSAADADFLTDANGGNLNITATGSGAVKAYADALTLAVKVGATATAGATTTLGGDVKSANITLTNGGNITNGDQLAGVSITTTAAPTATPAAGSFPAENNWALTSLTLSGNGSATVVNTNGKLATVDASALGGTLAFGANAGNITGGLDYTGSATVAETIKLGSGADIVRVASTFDKLDTIEGFDAKKETATADLKSVTDTIVFGGVTLNGAAAGQATKVTLSANATSLDLAFVEAAAADTAGGSVAFFQFGGNTYLFQDQGTEALEAADLAVKVVGTVDFAAAWGVYSA